MEKPLQVFCCYAREDQSYLLTLKKHLRPMQHEGLINVQADMDISPGEDWKQKISKYLDTAQIILLFISPDFMASNYCYSIEMQRAMERHRKGEAFVIPIILRPTLWQNTPFGILQALPVNAIPVTSKDWHSPDEAFFNIVEGIDKVIKDLLLSPSRNRSPILERSRKNFQEGTSSRTSPIIQQNPLFHPNGQSSVNSSQNHGNFDQRYQHINHQYNADQITINQHLETSGSFTLLELEQIMKLAKKAQYKWDWIVVIVWFITITIIEYVISNTYALLEPTKTVLTIIFDGVSLIIMFGILRDVMIPQGNKIVQEYTNDQIKTTKELLKVIRDIKKEKYFFSFTMIQKFYQL